MTVEMIREMIKEHRLELGTSPEGKVGIRMSRYIRDDVVETVKENRDAIIEVLTADKKAEEEKAADRARRINEIDGLAEIKKAMLEIEAWNYKFNRSFENEYGFGGMGVGKRPEYDIDAMKAEHPRAAAYLKAEAMSYKSNHEMAAIGARALEEVIFGDYEKAMQTMDAELEAFTERHLWD